MKERATFVTHIRVTFIFSSFGMMMKIDLLTHALVNILRDLQQKKAKL